MGMDACIGELKDIFQMLQSLDPGISSVSQIPEGPDGSRVLLHWQLDPLTWKSLFLQRVASLWTFRIERGGIQSQSKWGLDEAMPVAIYEFSRSSQSLSFQNKQTNNSKEILCQ